MFINNVKIPVTTKAKAKHKNTSIRSIEKNIRMDTKKINILIRKHQSQFKQIKFGMCNFDQKHCSGCFCNFENFISNGDKLTGTMYTGILFCDTVCTKQFNQLEIFWYDNHFSCNKSKHFKYAILMLVSFSRAQFLTRSYTVAGVAHKYTIAPSRGVMSRRTQTAFYTHLYNETDI